MDSTEKPGAELLEVNTRAAEEKAAELVEAKIRKAREAELEEIRLRAEEKKEKELSKDQEKLADKGHYEESKRGDYLFWGFLLCAVVLSAPLGGGFGFLLAPTQAASFGLLPFWKRKARRKWVKDPAQPDDKLLTGNDLDEAGVDKDLDELMTPEQKEQLLADMQQQTEMGYVLKLAENFGFEKMDELVGEKIKEAARREGSSEIIRGALAKHDVESLMAEFANSTGENREEITGKLFDGFTESLLEIAKTEQFKDTGLADFVDAGIGRKGDILNNMMENFLKGGPNQSLEPFQEVQTQESMGNGARISAPSIAASQARGGGGRE